MGSTEKIIIIQKFTVLQMTQLLRGNTIIYILTEILNKDESIDT